MFPNHNTPNSYTPGSFPPASSTTDPSINTPEYYPTQSPSAPPAPTMYPHDNTPDNYCAEPPLSAPPLTSMHPHNTTNGYYPSEPPPPLQQKPPPVMGIPASYASEYPPRAASSPLQVQFQAAKVPWTTGRCDCFDDVGNCCMTMFCPCVTFGRIAEIVDRGSSSCAGCAGLYTAIMCLTGCACLYSCRYRTKLRRQYSLPGGSCGDCLAHCCCECCALCQEYRELKNRGFDMHIGWEANVAKQQQGVTVAPAVGGGMIR